MSDLTPDTRLALTTKGLEATAGELVHPETPALVARLALDHVLANHAPTLHTDALDTLKLALANVRHLEQLERAARTAEATDARG